MSKSLTILAALAAVSAPAFAQGFYVDGGYQHIMIDEDGVDADLGAVTGHLGYSFSDFFAVEAEGSIGVKDETVDILGTDVDLELNYLVGAFARGQLPLGQNATLFARAGVVNAELEVSGPGASASESESGYGYGAGGEFMFSERVGLRGEYTRYDIDDLEADTFTVAAVLKF